jgi:hypothetical protein
MEKISRAERLDSPDRSSLLRLAVLRKLLNSGGWLVVLAIVIFIIAFWRVLIGERVLIGADVLYAWSLPWTQAAGSHFPRNVLVGDPVTQFLPLQELVAASWKRGQVPLWDSSALSGKPLLANDISAPFSPFTWFAIPFPAAVGLSLAMLLKLWIAGIGMGLYLSKIGSRGIVPAAGGVAYATSSFMVVWLGWPQASVAALIPWAFWSAEWLLTTGSIRAVATLSLIIALQFLAGHAETSWLFGLGFILYCLIRWAAGSRSFTLLAALALAAVLGVALSAVQLIPFIAELLHSTLAADRSHWVIGVAHLELSNMSSWLVPNAHGNPGIDGSWGRPPNYIETTGFAGVAMLVLAPLGLITSRSKFGSPATALFIITGLSAAVVYTPLSLIVGRVPGLTLSWNFRMLVTVCFGVVALGSLGLESTVRPHRQGSRTLVYAATAVGGAMLMAIAVGGWTLWVRRSGVASLWPSIAGRQETFWVALSASALVAAVAFIAVGYLGRSTTAQLGLGLLILAEGILFLVPFQPQVPLQEVPPSSQTMAWLQTKNPRTAPIAATGTVILPETSTLYGVPDVRAYDVVRDPRSRAYWSAADPGYQEPNGIALQNPRSEWLAAAGVHYVVTPAGQRLPGTTAVTSAEGTTISSVPEPKPFAYLTSDWSTANEAASAVRQFAKDPAHTTVIEGVRPASGTTSGSVTILTNMPGSLELRVTGQTPAALVVLQSYADGWNATIDGHAAIVHPANVQYQAVLVTPGTHIVSLKYEPLSLQIGICISGAGVILLLLLVTLGPRWLRRLRGQSTLTKDAVRRRIERRATVLASRARLGRLPSNSPRRAESAGRAPCSRWR